MLSSVLSCLLLLVTFSVQASGLPPFNGKDLTGWSGDPRLWRVENGVIIGETDETERKITANSFLIWQGGEPADFQLEFQARVTGDNNSGVQYRSRIDSAASWAVSGYQFDLHPNPPYLGMLYDENGRGVICERGQIVTMKLKPQVTGVTAPVSADLSAWNSYRIVAHGNQLRHFINGKLVAEAQDEQVDQRHSKGILALQLHSGPAMKVEFKDLKLQYSLKSEPVSAPTAAWLWKSARPGENETVYFRREFQLPPNLASAAVTVVCDNRHRLYVNGVEVGAGEKWSNSPTYDVLARLNPGGRNVIAVEGTNESGPAGLALRFRCTMQDGKKLHVVSDASWLCSGEAASGWQQLDFPVQSWSKVVVVAAKMGLHPWRSVAMPPEE
jgi:hypothetical protein